MSICIIFLRKFVIISVINISCTNRNNELMNSTLQIRPAINELITTIFIYFLLINIKHSFVMLCIYLNYFSHINRKKRNNNLATADYEYLISINKMQFSIDIRL